MTVGGQWAASWAVEHSPGCPVARLARSPSQAQGFVYSSNLSDFLCATPTVPSTRSLARSPSLPLSLLHFDCIFDCWCCWVLVLVVCPLRLSLPLPLFYASLSMALALDNALLSYGLHADIRTHTHRASDRVRTRWYSRTYITNQLCYWLWGVPAKRQS